MADLASSTGADGPEAETPTQRQARLRREKRQKKMADEGEDRLAKIKALNGGVAPPAEVLGGPQGPKAATADDDPDEVDISHLANNSNTRSTQGQNDSFAAAMRQMQEQQGGQGNGSAEDDPMMRMMQQMMDAMGGQPQQQDQNNPNADQQLPQMLQALMNGQQQEKDQAPPATGSVYLWKIVHAVFAISLAVYLALTSTFNGTELGRSQSIYADQATSGLGPRLFAIFTSAELVLQSVRYFTEGGQLQGNGMLATVANSGIVPQPYANWIHIGGRYIGIAQTIFSDAMVIVFTLGCMAWWHDVNGSKA